MAYKGNGMKRYSVAKAPEPKAPPTSNSGGNIQPNNGRYKVEVAQFATDTSTHTNMPLANSSKSGRTNA